jgi:preprotein translocase subunit YajC
MDAGPLIFLAAMVAVLWFVLIRPQRRRQQAHVSMVSALSPGDEVITMGGMYGRVRTIADDHLVVEIAPGTEIRLAKEAIASIVPRDAEKPATGENDG